MLLDLMVVLMDTYPDNLGSVTDQIVGLDYCWWLAYIHMFEFSCVRNIGFFEGDRCCVFDFLSHCRARSRPGTWTDSEFPFICSYAPMLEFD